MIGFAPFDEPQPIVAAPRKKPTPSTTTTTPSMFKKECTECNYIVLFFVIGVMLLALGDNFKR